MILQFYAGTKVPQLETLGCQENIGTCMGKYVIRKEEAHVGTCQNCSGYMVDIMQQGTKQRTQFEAKRKMANLI